MSTDNGTPPPLAPDVVELKARHVVAGLSTGLSSRDLIRVLVEAVKLARLAAPVGTAPGRALYEQRKSSKP